jgi:hypothetical protein
MARSRDQKTMKKDRKILKTARHFLLGEAATEYNLIMTASESALSRYSSSSLPGKSSL